jgi:tetratricopeptide (TPR) repeat protein
VADSARIQELRRRVQQDPATLAFAPLAEELRRAGQTAEAIKVCQAGLAVHPQYLSARATLGRALFEAGDLDSALIELSTVLGGAPENLTALKGVAEIHEMRGDLDEALVKYRLALALAGRDAELQRIVHELERQLPQDKVVVSPAAHDAAGGHERDRETVRQLERFLAAVVDDRHRRTAGP